MGWVRVAAAAVVLGWMPSAHAGGDGPEISRSRGKKGGVVVLYPRIVPSTDAASVEPLAAKLQAQLADVARQVVAANKVDVRPAPERVCSQVGCKATSVGVMLGHRNGGCAVVGMVSGPGVAPQQLIPLAGTLQLQASSAPFRQPTEQVVTVQEFARCEQVLEELDLSGVRSALERLVPQP